MSDLLPCPFCRQRLEKVEAFSTRTTATYDHPDNGCFLSGHARVVVSDREEDKERAARWNDRPSLDDQLECASDDEFEDELNRRIKAGEINIGDYADMEEWDGTIELTYAGSLALNTGALDDAIGRLKRGETREALYQLEKSMDGHLDGLADLQPEDLR